MGQHEGRGDPRALVRPAGADAVEEEHVQFVARNHRADLLLELSKFRLRLFNAHAGMTARMQAHLAGVHIREEVLTDQPGEAE